MADVLSSRLVKHYPAPRRSLLIPLSALFFVPATPRCAPSVLLHIPLSPLFDTGMVGKTAKERRKVDLVR